MLVKKINPEWHPAENPGLQVGETVDITDARALVLNGDVVAVTSDGTEISGYELFGVLAGQEKKEFEEWLAMKRSAKQQDALKAEKKALETELAATPATIEVKAPAIVAKTAKTSKK